MKLSVRAALRVPDRLAAARKARSDRAAPLADAAVFPRPDVGGWRGKTVGLLAGSIIPLPVPPVPVPPGNVTLNTKAGLGVTGSGARESIPQIPQIGWLT